MPSDKEKWIRSERFLEEISRSIKNILLAHFPELSEQDKEDIDHEVKLKLWKNFARGKKITNLRSYLWRAVYTTALDIVAEKMNSLSVDQLVEIEEKRNSQGFPSLSPDSSTTGEEETSLLVNKALGTLPSRRKAVLSLHLSGLSIKQIATSLGWRENQVRHLLYRGLSDLRQVLRELKE
ncbi:MAG: RNA polymerase sigma factor [Candidatus Aminicenantales bacterium]